MKDRIQAPSVILNDREELIVLEHDLDTMDIVETIDSRPGAATLNIIERNNLYTGTADNAARPGMERPKIRREMKVPVEDRRGSVEGVSLISSYKL